MSPRKFYKTTLRVVVLSEEPFEWDDLSGVAYAITDGDCSGMVEETGRKTLNGKQTANELIKQGSAPEFFRLTKAGNDTEE